MLSFRLLPCALLILLSMAAINAQDMMFWTDMGAGTINKANVDGSNAETVLSGLGNPFGISLDLDDCKMYWTSISNGLIRRANLDGTGVETIFAGLTSAGGVRAHIPGGWVYWTDSSLGVVKRGNLLGTIIQTLASGILSPIGLDIDEFNQKLYWVASGSGNIWRSNLNGSGIEVVVSGLVFPVSVAVDGAAGKVYWVDLGATKIQRANLNGTGVEDLLSSGVDGGGLFGFDRRRKKLSYCHFGNGQLRRINADGSGDQALVGGLTLPLGIALALPVPGNCFPGTTALTHTFGVGCAGAGATAPEIGTFGGGVPSLGNPSFTLTLTNADAGMSAWLLWSDGVVPGGFAVGPCALYLPVPPGGIDNLGPIPTNLAGGINFTFGVSSDPSLAGLDIYAQWMVQSLNGAFNGLNLSNGLQMRFGFPPGP